MAHQFLSSTVFDSWMGTLVSLSSWRHLEEDEDRTHHSMRPAPEEVNPSYLLLP